MKAILVLILGTYAISVQPIPRMAGDGLSQQASQAEQDAHPNSQAQPETGKAQGQPQESPPQNPQAPAQTQEQNAQAPVQAPEQSVPPKPEVTAPPAQPEAAAPQASPAAKSKPAKRSARRRRKKTSTPSSGPRKRVIRDGGTSEPTSQLAPGISQDQAKRSRQTTDQLLSSSQENLKRACARTLNSNQQATVDQIKVFIDQANAALKAGDFQRGRNFAMKAHALSEDLLRQ